jgi:hypothetical protein
MKVTIELPLENYDQLLHQCETSSPEFSVLVNGCIDRRPVGDHVERIVQILCETEQAVGLLSRATRDCPEAIAAIKQALRFPADQ